METIPKNQCKQIGFFRKTHGIHGEVVLEFEPQYELSLEEPDWLFVELEGLLVPFYIMEDGFRFRSGNSAIIQLEDVDSDKRAKHLIGKGVFLFQDEIVHDPEHFTTHELTGYQVIDRTLGEIGPIVQVDDYSGNIVLTIECKNDEILVPFNEELVVEADDKQKILVLNLPEGLLEA